jgi:hypothetical protein
VDREAVALTVLAHFIPGAKVLDFLAPQSGWLDVRYCAEDDDDTFYRELRNAEVIWHVLRPLGGRRPRKGATAEAGAQAGRRGQHHRRRHRDPPRYRGGQHARQNVVNMRG